MHFVYFKDEEIEAQTGVVTYTKQFIFGKGSLAHIPTPRPKCRYHG